MVSSFCMMIPWKNLTISTVTSNEMGTKLVQMRIQAPAIFYHVSKSSSGSIAPLLGLSSSAPGVWKSKYGLSRFSECH